MKICTSLRRLCANCRVLKRKKRLFIVCKNARHKQSQR